jgi:hypothetical protein
VPTSRILHLKSPLIEKGFSGAESPHDKIIKAVRGAGITYKVTMTVFIFAVCNGDRLTEARKEIFNDCFAARRFITVTGLARPGLLIEIQDMAVIGGKSRRAADVHPIFPSIGNVSNSQ